VTTASLADQWIDAWNTHDVERVLACLTADALYEDVPLGAVNRGADAVRGFIQTGWAAFPDMRFELTTSAISGDHGTAEWVMAGTHAGDFPGLPATGRPFSVRGVSVLELAGDKIRSVRDYWDFATVLRQLGFLPEHASD
jgi:steroid delta-isomerase-like uncharacterized protein